MTSSIIFRGPDTGFRLDAGDLVGLVEDVDEEEEEEEELLTNCWDM